MIRTVEMRSINPLIIKVARIYLRVGEVEQSARMAGYYVAGVYREKASGARVDRPELQRMIADFQPGEVVVAEEIDLISRLPLPEAELLIHSIRGKGARLAIPGVVDLRNLRRHQAAWRRSS